MVTLITFIVSGTIVVILIVAKVYEERTRKSFFLLNLISKGDTRFRDFSQSAAHRYADLKEKTIFMLKRQVPLHTRNIANKTFSLLQEKSKKYASDIKDGRLFGKKNGGISEFLKDISEMEKDNEMLSKGEEEGSQNDESQVK
jgi:hypothetical protein